MVTRSEEEMLQLLVSDEANFLLCMNVNTQKLRRYAELKSSNPEEGGRPEQLLWRLQLSSRSSWCSLACGMCMKVHVHEGAMRHVTAPSA